MRNQSTTSVFLCFDYIFHSCIEIATAEQRCANATTTDNIISVVDQRTRARLAARICHVIRLFIAVAVDDEWWTDIDALATRIADRDAAARIVVVVRQRRRCVIEPEQQLSCVQLELVADIVQQRRWWRWWCWVIVVVVVN